MASIDIFVKVTLTDTQYAALKEQLVIEGFVREEDPKEVIDAEIAEWLSDVGFNYANKIVDDASRPILIDV